ncbi:MAG: hypothetical protein AB7K24_28420, partial [Gemmataceae bacterium]
VANGHISAPVAALTQGVLDTMFWNAIARYAAVLLVVVAAGAAAFHWTTAGAVPLPQDPDVARRPAGRPVSKPATHDDLEVTVSPTQPVFAAGQPVAFDVKLANKGERPFWLEGAPWVPNHPYYTLRVEATAGTYRGPWQPGPAKMDDNELRRAAAAVTLLKPGESTEIRVVLEDRMMFESSKVVRADGTKDQRAKWFDKLPVGHYQFAIDIDMTKLVSVGALPGGTPHRVWKNKLASQPVNFEIAEAVAGQVHAQAPVGNKVALERVYRSADELSKSTGLDEAVVARFLKLDRIDFDKHMLVHVALGRRSDTSTLEIAGIDRFADGTTVVRCLKRTGKLDMVTQPGALGLIDRSAGEVIFAIKNDR